MKKPTNPGLKKLPTAVRNKMGYMADGGNPEKKKTPKNLEELEAYNTLKRETKGFQPEKLTPPSELGVVNNLRNAAQDGAKKAQEVGARVVEGAKNMGSKAKKALKTLQNPTAAKKALEEARKEREGKAYGGKVKKMAYGGKAMKMGHGGKVSKSKKSSCRGDGIAQRGRTKGRMV